MSVSLQQSMPSTMAMQPVVGCSMPYVGGGGSNSSDSTASAGPSLAMQAPVTDFGVADDDVVPIGIEVGGGSVRVALWRRAAGTPATPSAVPAVLTYVRPSTVEVDDGCWAKVCEKTRVPHALHTIVDPARLLGRTFGSVDDQHIEREAVHQGCTLAVEAQADGHAPRFEIRHMRVNQHLRNRAGDDGGARKTTPLIKQVAPEEATSRLIGAARAAAVRAAARPKEEEVEPSHAAVAVPADWGFAQRRAAYDSAILAGLTPGASTTAVSHAHPSRAGAAARHAPSRAAASHL